ncbi:hypothetical protein ACIQ34_04605 [Ureibacillus sp. NPDC094379]
MNNVIDFISIKQQKQDEQVAKVFSKANSLQNPEQINKLVEEKSLAIQDHKLFLAFLAYLEEKQIDAVSIFQAVLKLPKHQFELQYSMNWHSVVQLCFTFLSILKENEPKHYQQFISVMK